LVTALGISISGNGVISCVSSTALSPAKAGAAGGAEEAAVSAFEAALNAPNGVAVVVPNRPPLGGASDPNSPEGAGGFPEACPKAPNPVRD